MKVVKPPKKTPKKTMVGIAKLPKIWTGNFRSLGEEQEQS